MFDLGMKDKKKKVKGKKINKINKKWDGFLRMLDKKENEKIKDFFSYLIL